MKLSVKVVPQATRAFRIERVEVKGFRCPFNTRLAQDGNLDVWAASYSGFLRAFTEAILMAALDRVRPAAELVA